jgi:hypothetical protein
MKVGAYDAACAREPAARRTFQKTLEHFSQSTIFSVSLFKNLYGRSMAAIRPDFADLS